MTHAVSDQQLDRAIQGFLEAYAEDLAGAPSAADVAGRLGTRVAARGQRFRLAPQLAWLVIVGLLLAATVASLFGAFETAPNPLTRAYEAVFLRHEEIDELSSVIVVSVDRTGTERELARFPLEDRRYAFMEDFPFGDFMVTKGAVSPEGLLAVPIQNADYTYRWQVLDLRRPGAAPVTVDEIQQDFDHRIPGFGGEVRPSAVWGPAGRLAIPWYVRRAEGNEWRVSFVEARTGAVQTAVHDDLAVALPYWAGDGSALLLQAPSLESEPVRMLAPDGSVTASVGPIVGDGHYRHYRADGSSIAASVAGLVRGARDGLRTRVLHDADAVFQDVAWAADGSAIWVLGRRIPTAGTSVAGLWLERWVEGAPSPLPASNARTLAASAGLDGRLAGLAPDDSLLVVRLTQAIDAPGGEPGETFGLLVPGADAWLEVDGSFAGWLEVSP